MRYLENYRRLYDRGRLLGSHVLVRRERRKVVHIQKRGHNLLAFANEDVGRTVRLGLFETSESAFLTGQVRAGDICFDVGANIGYFSVLMAKASDRVAVHCFEPIVLNAALINVNALLNSSTIVVNNVAVGAESGLTDFSVSKDSAYSSIRATGRSPEASSIQVEVTTLDAYIAAKGLPRVDILKIDVEGAEGEVLQGAYNLLSDPSRRPRVILVELFDENLRQFESSVPQMIELMQKFGYIANIINEKTLALEPGDANSESYNFVFVPD